MYLHAGNNKNIRIRGIIGIFDTDNATRAQTTKKFLTNAQKNGSLDSAADEIPKSFILHGKGKNTRICLSPLAVTSLAGRLSTGNINIKILPIS